MDKVKYTHIMIVNSFVYNDQIINMIKSNKKEFKLSEHRFIFINLESYCSYKDLESVILEDDLLGKNFKKFKEYIESSEIVLMHSFPLNLFQLCKLKKEDLSKLVWIVWGHDLYKKIPKYEKGISLYRQARRTASIILKKIELLLYPIKIKQLKAIGIGFKYDALEIKKLYGDKVEIVMLPYGFSDNKEKIDSILNDETFLNEEKNNFKVMIGHSGYKFLNHEKILNQLFKYKEKNMVISLPLSYGDEEYICEVEKIANNLYGNKIEIIKEKMKFEEYLKYLKTVDIVILDFEHQAALGNLFLLLYLGKKIYLAKKSIIYFAMKAEGIDVGRTGDIGEISYEEFIKDTKKIDLRAKEYSSYILNEKNMVKQWESTLKNFE